MDTHPYINAIVAIVLIVAIVAFTDLYTATSGQRTTDDVTEGSTNFLTGNVVATNNGLEKFVSCTCVRQVPYSGNGPLSFALSTPSSACTNSLCSEAGSKYGSTMWMAIVR